MKFKDKFLKEIRNKGVVFLAACAILSGLTGTVMAASASAALKANERSATTPLLGNTTGKIGFSVANGFTSTNQVEAVLKAGTNSSSVNTEITSVKVGTDSTYYKVWNVDKAYTVVRSTVYGYRSSDPRTGCIAFVYLSNQ